METKLHTLLGTKRFNVNNFSYNRKNTRTTFDVGLIICVSFAKERKTQVGLVVVAWRKV
jgi:hypothetical protein